MILNAFQTVLMILVLIAVGYFVTRAGWADKSVQSFIPKFITNITLPCTVVINIASSLSRDGIGTASVYLLAALLAMAIAYLLGMLVARIIKIKKGQRGVFTVLFSMPNTGFMGLPVAMAIFGEEGMLFAVFFFVANVTLMNSIGYLGIERDGTLMSGGAKGNKKQLIKQILSPPLLAVIVGMVLVLVGAGTDTWPVFLSSSVEMLGNITSPLALVFVGMALHSTGLSCIKRIDKGISWSLIGRFILSPLIMFFIAWLFRLPAYATGVFVVQAGLPAMVATTIFAKSANADVDLAARGVVISTILSFISIPLYILILGL